MSRLSAVLTRRVLLLTFLLCTAAALLVLAPPPSNAAVMCNGQTYTVYIVTYFSNNSFNQVVGTCRQSCSGVTCTGTQTRYYSQLPVGCCPIS